MPARRWAVLCASVMLLSTMPVAVATAYQPTPPGPPTPSDVEVDLVTTADGFTTPVWGTTAPGDRQRLYVADQNGKVWAIKLHPERNPASPSVCCSSISVCRVST